MGTCRLSKNGPGNSLATALQKNNGLAKDLQTINKNVNKDQGSRKGPATKKKLEKKHKGLAKDLQ